MTLDPAVVAKRLATRHLHGLLHEEVLVLPVVVVLVALWDRLPVRVVDHPVH